MADGVLPYQNPTVTDKRLDTEELTVSALTVQRERIQVAGATDVGIATVTNAAPASTDYGLSVRQVGSANITGAVTLSGQGSTSLDGFTMGNLIRVMDMLAQTLALAMEPVSGRLRVVLDNTGGAAQTLGTVSTVSTVTTVTTLSGTTALTPGTAAANLGKAEDAVHAGGDTGVMALAVLDNSPVASANVSLSGDYTPLRTDNRGRLWVNGAAYLSFPVSTNVTSVVKNSRGFVHGVTINANSTGQGGFILYDNTTASGGVIASINTTGAAVGRTLLYDCEFTNGISVSSNWTTPADLTLTYL